MTEKEEVRPDEDQADREAGVATTSSIDDRGPLLQAHIDELTRESAIDPAVAAERGYETIDAPTGGNHVAMERLEKIGIPDWALKGNGPWPGLLIPMYAPCGERLPSAYQFKPKMAMQNAKGKPMKYASQKGGSIRLDVHPRWTRLSKSEIPEIKDASRALIITEGIKKADALTSRGFVTVGITGVDNWRRSPDWNDITVKDRKVYLAFDADARTNPNVRRALNELARWLKKVKKAKEVYFLLPPEMHNGKPTKGVDDYFAAGGTAEEFKKLREISLPKDDKASASPFTDALMAQRYVDEVLAGQFLYVPSLGWMRHDGKRYVEVEDRVPLDAMRRHAVDRYGDAQILRGELVKEGATQEKLEKAQVVIEGWYSAQSAGKLERALKLAKGVDEICEEAGRFDADASLLNTPGGVVDLRTLEVEPHGPDQRHTKITRVAYVPGAESRALKQALQSVPEGAEQWLQTMLGEATTGRAGDRLLLITGGGDNGKTAVIGAAFEALGSYAAKVPNTLLLKSKNVGGATPEKMTLRGTRLAYIEETPEDSYLDANMVKELLDAQVVEGRYLYKDFISWKPTHSLVLNTNHVPTMVDTGHGAWRRVTRLPFPYKYVGEGVELSRSHYRRADPWVKQAMSDQEGLEAMLAWMIAGAQRALGMGTTRQLDEPAEVIVAVQDWRSRSDDLMTFVDTYMVQGDEELMCSKQDFFVALNKWLKDQEKKPWTLRTFVDRLRGHAVLGEEITERDKASSANLTRPYWVDGDEGPFDNAGPSYRKPVLQTLAARTAVYVGIAFKPPGSDS
jgi:P4 family phage/plasmid primase-like protien